MIVSNSSQEKFELCSLMDYPMRLMPCLCRTYTYTGAEPCCESSGDTQCQGPFQREGKLGKVSHRMQVSHHRPLRRFPLFPTESGFRPPKSGQQPVAETSAEGICPRRPNSEGLDLRKVSRVHKENVKKEVKVLSELHPERYFAAQETGWKFVCLSFFLPCWF